MGERAVVERGMESLEEIGTSPSTTYVLPQELTSLLGRYGKHLSGGDADAVRSLQALAEDVTVETGLRRYIVELARTTREDDRTEVGVSPRGVQRVFEAARARAVLDGRSYAAPGDVKTLARSTMSHRLVLTTDATVEGVEPREVVETALSTVDVPAVSPAAGEASATAESPPDDTPAERRGPEHEDGSLDGA